MEILAVGEHDVVVADPAVRAVYQLIRAHLADARIPVLIHGETGVGKELVAVALHEWSRRREGPFVTLNCAAVPDTLVDSVLFGHRRGAFTGADGDRLGLFRTAHGGTLFLDEIGEMSEHAQSKLLRVLETQRVRPVGDTDEVGVDVRVVAATNRSLRKEVEKGRFRKDLYFRLRGAPLKIPPLRERPADLVVLAEKFLLDACIEAGRAPTKMSEEFVAELRGCRWPGNVRELESAMSYLGIVVEQPVLQKRHFELWSGASADLLTDSLLTGSLVGTAGQTDFRPIAEEIAELERDRMRRALVATRGRRNEAAALIRMPLRTFTTKLKAYGLDRLELGAGGQR